MTLDLLHLSRLVLDKLSDKTIYRYFILILLGGELIRKFTIREKTLEFLPWIKNPILLMLAVGFKPTTSQPLSFGVNT